MASKEKEIAYAKKHRFERLGPMNVEVKVDLADDERIRLGKEQAEALMAIEVLEGEKKNFDDDLRAQIRTHEENAVEIARIVNRGFRIEERSLPCFIDLKAKERVYVDLETEEILHRAPMREEDRQVSIGA